MTDLSLAAQAVMDAYINNCGWLDGPFKKDYQCVAAVLRAAVAHTQMYQGNDCYSNEVWTCDADELLAIATELENQ
jgi:hypothetical protein